MTDLSVLRVKHLKMKKFKSFCPTHACTAPEEHDSDYDNVEDGDLKTGGDVKTRGDLLEKQTAKIMTGGGLKTRGNLLEEPTAKIIEKKVPRGAFSPRRESLGILQEFMSTQVSPLFA